VPCLCGVDSQIIVVDVCTKEVEWGQLLHFNTEVLAPFGHFKSLPSPRINNRSIQKADSYSFHPEGAES